MNHNALASCRECGGPATIVEHLFDGFGETIAVRMVCAEHIAHGAKHVERHAFDIAA